MMLRRTLRNLVTACAIGVGVACLASGSLRAAGPFDQSSLMLRTAPVVEGQRFTYDLAIRNSGPKTWVYVEFDVPVMAMFVGVSGLDGAKFDAHTGRVEWQSEIDAGVTRAATLDFIALPDSGGSTASLRVVARDSSSAEMYLDQSSEIDSNLAPTVMRLAGSYGVTAVGAAVLGWLAVSVVFWIVLRLLLGKRSAAGLAVGIMLPVGFLLYFAGLAREDARILSFPTRTCTVLDSHLSLETSSSSSSSSSPRTSQQQHTYAPLLALRYEADGQEHVGTGFGTGSRLSITSSRSAVRTLGQFNVGSRVPCFPDPTRPYDVYVERGYGGAYFFAAIPLLFLALVAWGYSGRRPRGLNRR